MRQAMVGTTSIAGSGGEVGFLRGMLDPNVKTTFPLSLGTTAQRRVALAERSPE